jgi:hypothetical protein
LHHRIPFTDLETNAQLIGRKGAVETHAATTVDNRLQLKRLARTHANGERIEWERRDRKIVHILARTSSA